jgi:hypothetical protein
MTDRRNGDDDVLWEFFEAFTASFHPPRPSRGKHGTNWLVSRVWTDALRRWLTDRFVARYEFPLPRRRRLDAALRSSPCDDVFPPDAPMDIALEWEWDNNKVAKDFCGGDFAKLFQVDARCGVAIVQTRVDGSRGTTQAEETGRRLRGLCRRHHRGDRAIGLIEIRRIQQTRVDVEFDCYVEDLVSGHRRRTGCWRYLDLAALRRTA